MAYTPDRNDTRLRDAIGAFKSMFSAPAPAPETPAVENARPKFTAAEQEMFDIKKGLIEQVRANATMNGIAPTLEHYRLACLEFAGTEQGLAMVARGEWNVRNQANLEYQDLSGFTIRDPKVAAAHEQSSLVEADYDGHDRDGDGQINVKATSPFYDNINFKNANLSRCFVEPATSFNKEIAEAACLEGMTFNNMRGLDTFTFNTGIYKDAYMKDIYGGEVRFADHSRVEGVHIEGKQAQITFGDHAYVEKITLSDNFRILRLEMGENAVLCNSNLDNCTIAPNSEFKPGATFQNVRFGTNVVDLDFSSANLYNVTVKRDNGEYVALTNHNQLDTLGIKYDANTTIAASPDLVRSLELAEIRTKMQGAIHGMQPAENAPAADLNSLDAIREAMQVAVKNIGKPLKPEEIERLRLTQEAREARLQEQAQSGGRGLPGQG